MGLALVVQFRFCGRRAPSTPASISGSFYYTPPNTNAYASRCLSISISPYRGGAFDNLQEALALHFEPPCATHPPKVRRIEVEVGAA